VNDLRNGMPPELDEMFRRREGDVTRIPELPTRVRRRIRTRQGLVAAAAAIAVAVATAIGVNLTAVGRGGDPDIGDQPPALSGPRPTHVAVTGRNDLFRWRILSGEAQDGRVPTILQTASLAGRSWYDATSTRLHLEPQGQVDTYLPGGVSNDRPNRVVVWGAFAEGVDRIVIHPGTPCSGRGPASDPIAVDRGGEPVWAVVVECGDGATVTELDGSGAELSFRPLPTPQPTYVWTVTSAHGDGAGWFLQRLVDGEGGVAIGDAGIPNDLQVEVSKSDLGDRPIAWGSTAAHPDGAKFVFGLNARTVESIVVVYGCWICEGARADDGGVVRASMQDFIEDPYGIFWIRVPLTTQALLLAFDASCNEVAREPVLREGTVTVPPDVCQTP